MASGFDESGVCDACGTARKLRRIESGQRLCRRCFQELKPPRSRHLASYQALEAFRRLGITLAEDTSRAELEELEKTMGVLRELVCDVWYTLRETSPRLDAVPDDRLTLFVYRLVETEDFGRNLAAIAAARVEAGHRQFREAWRLAEAKLHATLEVFDGRLLDGEGRQLAFFNFTPPLATDGTYWRLVGMLRESFPEYVGS